ncbi:hypothetical protein HPB48_011582 [Haemaphysalis longicornis]|uniref:Uncharacterized protein n=1 Tax=Haemaphysalis longicornis TaxID=44386 RepID=A0A9J6FMI0_HAELO|nr:hypothetical protein HPB48_011582 [Haemaphysalis longicornis]
MRTGFPTPISVLTATALTLHFCGCADASCLPQYRSSSVMHTACKPRPGNCVLVKSGLSAAEKQALLDAHNNYRSRIAKGQLGRFPPAKNMLRMGWGCLTVPLRQLEAIHYFVKQNPNHSFITMKKITFPVT